MYQALLRWTQRRWFYDTMRALYRVAARLLFGVRVQDRHLVPTEGGLIIAANHIGTLDPPALGTEVPRRISFMAKKELFENPFLNLVFRGVRAFPIDREGNDVTAIKEALRRLKGGDAVGIFIQGTRNKGDAEALDGAAFLAQRAGVPIQPAAIWREGRRFHVRFGEPFSVEGRDRASMHAATQTTMRQIYELIPVGHALRPAADEPAPSDGAPTTDPAEPPAKVASGDRETADARR
jgi:1-acyl-sn-glycerol-3-phosphate acyltransferase